MTDWYAFAYFSVLGLVCGFGVFMVIDGIVHPERYPSLWEDKE